MDVLLAELKNPVVKIRSQHIAAEVCECQAEEFRKMLLDCNLELLPQGVILLCSRDLLE